MEMNSKRTKSTTLQLTKEFVVTTMSDGSPTIWYWRGGWYVWNGHYYAYACQEGMEHRILLFLEGQTGTTVSGATIRAILDLLRIVQYHDKETAPCWLHDDILLDPNELFVVKNGMLHIAGSQLLARTPALFNLSAAEFEYCRSASCPRWEYFLTELWENDENATSQLQEWFGYCLLPDTSQQKILAVVGPPRSGKSTIARVLRELLGRQNVACPSIRSLSGQFGLWALLDKSLAIIPDATLPRPCPAVEELLKSVSGEDAVDIHRKGMAPLTGIRLPTRIMILANEMPSFHDPSGALERRLITLQTTKSYFGNEDATLTNKLLEELPGILNWAIEGRTRLHARGRFECSEGLAVPNDVAQALPEPERIRRIVVEYGGYERRRRNRRKDRKRRVHRHPK